MFKALALNSFRLPAFSRSKRQTSWLFWLSAALLAANIVLLMSYVYGVNDFASRGYEIKSLQKRLAVLGEENNKINLKVSEASSMVAIQTGFLSANFVPAGGPKFVEISGNQFTQR